ncbi:chondroitin AC/alginate lyase [Auriculariales sp. MPI-PUGE-AT-0066]|nr:chondroitin AC/alginate lyase [Auriculariales sp. MPI-PUGE-AT-0066]
MKFSTVITILLASVPLARAAALPDPSLDLDTLDIALDVQLESRAPKTPQTVVIAGSRLAEARSKLKSGKASTALKKSYAAVKKDADSWLKQGPWSVTAKSPLCDSPLWFWTCEPLRPGFCSPGCVARDARIYRCSTLSHAIAGSHPPPSIGFLGRGPRNVTNNVHDYYSMAPYYWPTKPKTQDNPLGCPWETRDGQRNPAVDKGTDRQNLGKVAYSVPSLALAWYYSGNTKYAKHASLILRTWFVNSKTRMTPNLQHGQVIMCENTGRSIGIIDFSQYYTGILDAVRVLESGSGGETGWSNSDSAAFKKWNQDFYIWLTSSQFGKDETAQANNHGLFADMQRAAIALFLGWGNSAKSIVNTSMKTRINAQIEANGSQPDELARTRSFHYSCFNLVAFTRLAQIGSHVGVDVWKYKGSKGQSIFKAIDYILPAATGAKWSHPELQFTRYAALDVIHAASDAGHKGAHKAVTGGKLAAPPKGDFWYARPAAEQLDSIAG